MFYVVTRQDDNGNVFEVKSFEIEKDAEALRDVLIARGHKQTYWVDTKPDKESQFPSETKR